MLESFFEASLRNNHDTDVWFSTDKNISYGTRVSLRLDTKSPEIGTCVACREAPNAVNEERAR